VKGGAERAARILCGTDAEVGKKFSKWINRILFADDATSVETAPRPSPAPNSTSVPMEAKSIEKLWEENGLPQKLVEEGAAQMTRGQGAHSSSVNTRLPGIAILRGTLCQSGAR
jgi:hypothetical protein